MEDTQDMKIMSVEEKIAAIGNDLPQEPEKRIEIPSKFKCEKHNFYSDTESCYECWKSQTVHLTDLDGKLNLPFAVFYDRDTKQRGMVVNTNNIPELWDILHEFEDIIKSVKIQLIKRSQMTGVQQAPASVLDKLR